MCAPLYPTPYFLSLPCCQSSICLPHQTFRKGQIQLRNTSQASACPPICLPRVMKTGAIGQAGEPFRLWECVFASVVAGCENGGPTDSVRVPPR
jgi:hypothetical protein